MPMNRIGASAQGMFDGLKSKLGFSHNDEKNEHSYRDNDYDEYDDFDEYDDAYRQDHTSHSRNDAPSRTSGFKPVTVNSSYKGSSPDLVGFNDVKSYSRDSDMDRRQGDDDRISYSPRRTSNRNLVHGSTPAISSPTHQAQSKRQEVANERSEGFNSLFMPTTSSTNSRISAESSQGNRLSSHSGFSSGALSYTSSYSRREVSIVSPRSYEDVADVAHLVALGNLVALSFNQINESTKVRILDFCFGVASALHAQVEAPTSSLYVIAKGEGLTEEERATLIERGVLPQR